jgi:O-antigen ligase
MWHQPHNTYTQVSAECGIPGFLIYIATMVAAFRAALKIRRRTAGKPGFHDLHALSLAMFMTLACFALNAAFASLAYLTTFPMLAALADGLYRTAEREIVARERTQSVAPRPSVTSKNSFRLGVKPA